MDLWLRVVMNDLGKSGFKGQKSSHKDLRDKRQRVLGG